MTLLDCKEAMIDTSQLDMTTRLTLFASLPNGLTIAEIGVALGHFAKHVLVTAQPSIMYLIDHWREESKGDNPAWLSQSYQDNSYSEVCGAFMAYSEVRVIRKSSLEAALEFTDETLDVVYLDANHMDVARDIVAWWPKVKRGGLLSGHDYVFQQGYFHVKTDVDAWAARVSLPLLLASIGQPDDYPTWIVQKP